jgi:hypothetical protein
MYWVSWEWIGVHQHWLRIQCVSIVADRSANSGDSYFHTGNSNQLPNALHWIEYLVSVVQNKIWWYGESSSIFFKTLFGIDFHKNHENVHQHNIELPWCRSSLKIMRDSLENREKLYNSLLLPFLIQYSIHSSSTYIISKVKIQRRFRKLFDEIQSDFREIYSNCFHVKMDSQDFANDFSCRWSDNIILLPSVSISWR